MDPVSEPFKDVYADLTVSPNQRIGFHADARYNVYDQGLREGNADIHVVYPRFSAAAGPCFNEQTNNQYMKAEAFGRVEYVNRHGDENEFRISINLLGLGQVGTSARRGF